MKYIKTDIGSGAAVYQQSYLGDKALLISIAVVSLIISAVAMACLVGWLSTSQDIVEQTVPVNIQQAVDSGGLVINK